MLRRINMAILLSLVISLFIPFISGCDSDTENEKATAADIAKEWTADSMGTIAGEITDSIIELVPGVSAIPGISYVLSSEIDQQIADNVSWTITQPR